jgi:uncharacterized protein involved in exopolysaccharide biosynthesis
MADDPFESAEEERASNIDLMKVVVLPLWRARVWIVFAAVVGAGGGAVQSLLKPNEFSSLGKLLVRPGTRESTTPEGRVIGDGGGAPINLRESVQNQIHLVQNPEVFRRVVAELGPNTILEPYDPTANDNEHTPLHMRWIHQAQKAWFRRADACLSDPSRSIDNCPRCVDLAEEVVSKGVIVFPEMGSSVLTVTYTAHSPLVAKKVVDGFLNAALAHHQQVFDVDTTLQFLDTKVLNAQVLADLADVELTRYRNECGLYDYETQRSAHLEQIDTLEADLSAQESRLADLRSQHEFFKAALDKEPAELHSSTALAPLPNPEFESLAASAQRLRLELTSLNSTAEGTVAQLEAKRKQLQDQLQGVEAALASTPRMIELDSLRNTSPNPRYDWLLQRSREVDAERLGLIQAQALRRDRITELRRQLELFEECRPNLATKERAAKQAKDTLERFLASREQLALVNQLDSTQLTNLTTVQPASLPRTKSGPRRGRTVLIAGFLGAAAAVTLALLKSMLDQRRLARVASATPLPAASVVDGPGLEGGGRSPLGTRS